jgi:hypothetical protein
VTGTAFGAGSLTGVSPSGTVTPQSNPPSQTVNNATPTNSGSVTCSTAPASGTPFQIPTPQGATYPPYAINLTTGPDGNIWFTQSPAFDSNGNPIFNGTEMIGCMTPSGNVSEYTVPTLAAGTGSKNTTVGTYIAAGGDGNVWFVESIAGNIAKITPAGVITEYPLGIGTGVVIGLALGADSNMWVRSSTGKILRVTPSGTVTNFPTPTVNTGSDVELVLGPDRALWYPEDQKLGRITTAGVVTEFPLLTPTVSGAPNFSFQLVFAPEGPGALLEYTSSDVVTFTIPVVATHDFNGDGTSDILWRDTSGNLALWLINGNAIASAGGLGNVSPSVWSIVGQRDFTGSGNADILWRDTSGNLALWLMSGTSVSSTAGLGNVPTNWTIYGTGDLNGDGVGDILWRDSNTGTVAVWFMNSSGQVQSTAVLGVVPSNWVIVGSDSNGDICWRDSNTGTVAVWGMNGSQITQSVSLGAVPSNWVIVGTGDFNGDGVKDILWRDSNSGTVAIWLMNASGQVQSSASLGVVPSAWTVAQTGDYNGDGNTDILWIDTAGDIAAWFMNGTAIASTAGYGNVGTSWIVEGLNAE